MFVLFEEAGKFLTGRVLSQSDASAQLELDSGKRVKVKAANVLVTFEKPAPTQLLCAAREVSAQIELDMAWEIAPEDEFGFADLAREYFSDKATLEQQVGALISLFEAPHYFRRAGKGRFRKASADVLALALAAIEKKKQIQQQIDQWVVELGAGQCPDPVREQLYKILFKPDKNAPEYKAVVEASRATRLAPLDLLQKAGAISSAYQFHWRRFLFESFPKGIDFPELQAEPIRNPLPLAPVQAFSIDDSATTEIDDALSLQGLGSGKVVLGIHIAAPALAVSPGDAIDQLGRARMSTVYMPGYKITMLPDAVVQTYTLLEGRDCPAVSLYVSLDEQTLEITGSETRLERVPIVANLRHDQLDHVVTTQWLQQPDFAHAQGVDPLAPDLRVQLAFLYRLAEQLKAQRIRVRGKPETFNRPDYNFRLIGNDGAVPEGDEQVQISVRQRGAPLDLIVAEAMILANSTWGNWMAELGVPGIYRSQASLAPGVKVRMGTRALPHAGIGVPSYAWSTSPLRRYTDLVNQWQIIACARHGRTAALVAPFKPKDAELFSIISAFDAAYGAYGAFQAAMERFWTLQYLMQNQITELDAAVFKENMVRGESLPLVLPVAGARDLPRGARVRVRLGDIDTIALDLTGTVVERLDAAFDAAAPDADAGVDDDDEAVAGPIALAVDIGEGADAKPDGGDNPDS
ncbi:MAG: ribonuclease catalytic domain-containing protein [Burkholderiaceae bacterium]